MSGILKIAFWATVAGQIVLLLAFIAVKENTLHTGTSVLLQTVPIDPLSLLQGEYVVLDYEIAELPENRRGAASGTIVYVTLRESPSGLWRASRYSNTKPDTDQLFIKGTTNERKRLEFGIDTFFIPEGTGHIIERSRDVKVLVAINSNGTAVIDDLIVDGLPFDPSRPDPVITKEPPPLPESDEPPPPPLQRKP